MSNGQGGNGNPGMNRLASSIDEHIQRYSNDITSDMKIDTGTIGDDWSLDLVNFDIPIPKGEYLVCKWLTGLKPSTTVNGVYAHSHKAELPKLKKGDKVFVVWSDEEVIVVDVIVSSSEL